MMKSLNQGQHNGDDDLLSLYEHRKYSALWIHRKNVGVGLGCRIEEWSGGEAKDRQLFLSDIL